MRILQVTAEIFPLLKTGGLADIAGALPLALVAAGQDVRALLPGFPAIVAGVRNAATVADLDTPWGERVGLRLGSLHTEGAPDLPVYWIDAPGLYDRPGNPYEDAARHARAEGRHSDTDARAAERSVADQRLPEHAQHPGARVSRCTAFAARRSLMNVEIAGISDTTTMPMTISDRLSLTHGMLPNR